MIAGDQVCLVHEPNQLTCVDRRDPSKHWTLQLGYVDTLPEPERAAHLATVSAHADRQQELREARAERSRLVRELRRGAEVVPQLEVARERIAALEAVVQAVAPKLPDPADSTVGEAAATPLVHGESV